MPRVPTAEDSSQIARRELYKEASTMGLYVAICLLAALTALPDGADPSDVEVLALVWGTTLGLALAHRFAFEVSARLVAGGRMEPDDKKIALVQVAGAIVVAVATSVPILVLPARSEFDIARLVVAATIAAAGFWVARGGGGSVVRSSVYAGVTLVVGLTVALVKNLLIGH